MISTLWLTNSLVLYVVFTCLSINYVLCEHARHHGRSEDNFLQGIRASSGAKNQLMGNNKNQLMENNKNQLIEDNMRLYQHNVNPQLILRVIGALDKAVTYYEKNYVLLSFDGLFGAKVVEGQLNLVVAEYSKGFLSDIMDDSMKNDVVKIAARAGHVVKLAIPYLYEREIDYMKKMRRLFYLSWDIGHSHRMVDLSLTWSDEMRLQSQTDAFNEAESDKCLAELLEPVDGMMCKMSENCQYTMTKAGMEKYILSHQILYSVVAEMSGCGSRLEQWLVKHKRSGSLEQLQGEMCSNLYSEALALAGTTFNDNVATFRDLLLEMEFVCGMLGYVEFLRRDWLVGILEWQSDSGCFRLTKSEPNSNTGRVLLVEKKLSDGCMSHLTTVAVSALAVHLHYLLNPGPATSLKQKKPSLVADPSRDLQPPLPESNFMYFASGSEFNRPLFRENFENGFEDTRVKVADKSLEDKADIVMKHLFEKTSTSKEAAQKSSTSKSGLKNHEVRPLPPEQSIPFAQYLAATRASGSSKEYSMATFYFFIASIVLLMLGMVRYVHTKRRTHLSFRGKIRFL